MNEKRGDYRNFIHKRVFGAAKGFLGGGPLGAISGFVSGGGGSRAQGQLLAAQKAEQRAQQRAQLPAIPFVQPPQRAVPFQNFRIPGKPAAPPCPTGFIRSANGQCVERRAVTKTPGAEGFFQRLFPGGATGFETTGPEVAGLQQFGDAQMGQFGGGLQPAVRSSQTRICPRGAVLGADGLCYNKRSIANSERFWPRGRRPLLTGGDMRCISIASRAAKKLQRKQKQLQDMGMLKKPTRRAQKQLAPGHHAHVSHD